MDGEFGFMLGVMVSLWIGGLLWPTNSKEDKKAISVLCALGIVVHIAHEMLK